jgi:hypothetical protein
MLKVVMWPSGSAVYPSDSRFFSFMLQLITILNRCHRFPGFVYHQARFGSDYKSIEIAVRPRKGWASYRG